MRFYSPSAIPDSRYQILDTSSGFTLVELLVAIGLFSIIIAIAVGGFVHALRTERQVTALIAADSNLSLAIEQMAREIRTGTNVCLMGAGIPPGAPTCTCAVDTANDIETCTDLSFVNAENQVVVYKLQNGAIVKSTDGGTTFAAITGTNVTIPYFETTIFGSTPGDHWPSRVTIVTGVEPIDPTLSTSTDVVSIQTTVSVRAIDCSTGGSC